MAEWLSQNKIKITFLTVLLVNILAWSFYFSLPDGRLHLKVYDVGQGDSIFLKTAAGYRVLIDGGPNTKVLDYLGADLPFYSKRLDLLILTHSDADHLTGLLDVIKQYQIQYLWVNGDDKDTRLFKEWERSIQDQAAQVKIVDQGDRMVFPDSTEIAVLWPEKEYSSSKTNNHSIVVQVSFGNFDALLTGDADNAVQPYVSGMAPVEVLKVPHHGAKEALSEEFIRTISPEVSIISVGSKNRYGHPAEKPIQILEKFSSQIYRTDTNGTTEIVSDGESWYVK